MTFAEARSFITAWYESSSLAELEALIGIDRRRASNLAASMRRKGVKLPAMKFTVEPKTRLDPEDWQRLSRWSQAVAASMAIGERYRGRPKPKVENLINDFNREHRPGSAVLYFPVFGDESEFIETRTRSRAWNAGGVALVLIEGRTGGVAVRNVRGK